MFSATTPLEALVIEPSTPVTTTVIWLHGLGADGYDFEPIVEELGIPENAGVKFIFPHAPFQPVTINGGYVMRAWYDITHPDIAHESDQVGIEKSTQAVRAIIDAEIAQSRRVILAGFSQGGVIALNAGLRHPSPVEGILVLSSYLPFVNQVLRAASDANRRTPILFMHGRFDNIVPLKDARDAYEALRSTGYSVDWKLYSMAHSVAPDQVRDIATWLKARLAHNSR